GDHPTPSQSKYLQKLRSGHVGNIALLDAIETSAPRAFAPVPNRLCYVLHNSLPYSSGGYATRAQGMARGLTGTGFEVICLTRPGFPLDTKPELDRASVPSEDMIDGIRYLRRHAPLRKDISLGNY